MSGGWQWGAAGQRFASHGLRTVLVGTWGRVWDAAYGAIYCADINRFLIHPLRWQSSARGSLMISSPP